MGLDSLGWGPATDRVHVLEVAVNVLDPDVGLDNVRLGPATAGKKYCRKVGTFSEVR